MSWSTALGFMLQNCVDWLYGLTPGGQLAEAERRAFEAQQRWREASQADAAAAKIEGAAATGAVK